MGRYSEPLAVEFLKLAQVRPGQRALDVGCGPGVLTKELVERLGAPAVAAVDPSGPFVAATKHLFPDADVRSGSAETLPFPDDEFDLALAQLVVHFMRDPVAGLTEMRRVTHPGGVVAACVWDHAGGAGPLATFWRAVKDIDPDARDESELAGAREGDLVELFRAAGLRHVEPSRLSVRVRFATFDEWWDPYTLGVGPSGGYVARTTPERREELRARCAQLLPDGPVVVDATAWAVRARA